MLLLDKIRIRQILLNLVGNAVKFTEAGFVKVRLKLESIEKEGSEIDLCLVVEDTGIGIPEEEQSRIFKAFLEFETVVSSSVSPGLRE